MDEFKQLETQHYVGYLVVNEYWHRERQQYMDHGHILFSNEEDAQKCLKIMDEYKQLCRSTIFQSNKIVKDLFLFDGNTIHTLSGYKIKYDDYISIKNNVESIEDRYDKNTWIYMDEYVKLFGYRPRRPRSFIGSLLCCCTCACFCTDDVCTKVHKA